MGTLKSEEGEIFHWSEKQKQWFLRRDENTCQFVDFSRGRAKNCFNNLNLHIHAILPFRYGLKMGFSKEELTSPLNGIIICQFHHLNFIHPDIGILAKKMYRFTPESYKIIQSWHEALSEAKIPYWITVWDDVLKLIAKIRTREYLRKHPEDPFPV